LVRSQDPATQAPPATLTSKVTATESALDAANQLYREGKFAAAAEAFKAITNSADPSALAYVGLVRAYLALKNPDEAAAAAQKATKLAPSLDAVRAALGEVYFRQGKLAEAENEFTALVNAKSKEARAYLGLSRVYHAASYYRQAKIAIDRAHDLDPADPDILRTWIGTLSLAEQIHALEAFLAAHADDDRERRASQLEDLNYLQSFPSQDFHPCRLVTKPSQAEIKMDRLLQDANHIRGYGLSVKLNEASSRGSGLLGVAESF
jgi:tetratricopeptide (TPR) repeat protein